MTYRALTRRVRDIMGQPVITANESDSLEHAARLMINRNVGCLPVVDSDGDYVGMITERAFQTRIAGTHVPNAGSFEDRVVQQIWLANSDQAMAQRDRPERESTVEQFMTGREHTASEDMELWQVAELMSGSNLSHVAVLREGKPVGVVARHDLVKAFPRAMAA